MTIEPAELTEVTKSPIYKEKQKADPELIPHTSKYDKDQIAASCNFNFLEGTATLNIEEGEGQGADFKRVQGKQKTVDIDDLKKILANKSEAEVLGALAQYVLDTVSAVS